MCKYRNKLPSASSRQVSLGNINVDKCSVWLNPFIVNQSDLSAASVWTMFFNYVLQPQWVCSALWLNISFTLQQHKRSIFCMRPFVFDWFDVRIMLTLSIPSADWNGLFVPLDSLTHTQLHLSCKSIPAAPRSDEEKRAVGHQWSSSQRTSGEAVP